MCGILGIINIENHSPVDPALLTKMAATMAHRGPDGAGVWIQPDGQCGLAHRRLSIVDLSAAGHQPMGTPDNKIWITFNGEIYNYPALRRQMEERDYRFRSNSDTEVILYLYREYGDRFIEHLDGDFGIGLWDCERRRLILSRDRAGVKPVYYTYVDGRFIFASEIKALLQYPSLSREIDYKAFYNYLTFLVSPPKETMIKGINKLESACTLSLESSQKYLPKIEKYWLPLPKVDQLRSFESYDEELELLFSASVKKRLMADVPVGVLFSGGVDSTLNLCSFGQLIAPERVKTFTVGMSNDANFHDDSSIAREMAAKIGSEHHEVQISQEDLLQAAEKLAYLQDEPISDPVAVPLYFVTKLAKQHGVTVLQSGEGADELFCGYDNYRRFIRHYHDLWRPLAKLPRWVSGAAKGLLSYSDRNQIRKIRDVLHRRSNGQELFLSSAVAYYEMEKSSVLSKSFRNSFRQVDSFDVVAPYYAEINTLHPNASILQKMTFIELQLRLPELLLMRADKMAMANSIEIRVPFLDKDLIDFAMRVPDSYKLRNNISKEPIKRMAAKYVSRNEIYRPKTGFGLPVQDWFKGDLGKSFRELLNETKGIEDLLDVKELERKCKNINTVNDGFQIWSIYNFLMWKRAMSI